MSKEKLVPKLRFDGFTKVWESKQIGEIAEVVGGGTPKTEIGDYWDGEIKWFTPSEIGKTKYVFDSDRHITEKGLKNSSAKLLPKDAILLSSRATVGEISIALTECSTNQGFQSLITKSNVDNDFIYYLISTIKSEFLRRSSGSTFLEISKNEIKRMSINIPELSEQKKISNLFSVIDNKIEMLEKKCEYYQDFKKYLMQRIFSSSDDKLRFENKEEWKTVKLGDICKIKTGKLDANAMVENGKYRFYTCAKEYYFIDDYAYDTEALLISGNGAHVGYIHYYNGKFNAYQRTYILDQFTENIKLIMYILDKSLKKRIQQEKNEGSTPYIKLSTLKDMKIDIPQSKTEQEKITSIFTNVNNKLDYINAELKNVQNFKKGLLQQMFV